MHDATLSLIFPVQDEAASLPLVVQEALGILPRHFADFEIVIVVDGDDEPTLASATQLAADHDQVAVIQPRRRGYGASLIYAFAAVRGEYVLVMDADRRLTISDIAHFAPLVGLYDSVLGYRKEPGLLPRLTKSSLLHSLAERLFHTSAHDLVCGFKMFRRDLLERLDLQSNGPLIDIEIIAKAAMNHATIHETPITYYPAHEDGDRAVTLNDLLQLWRILRSYESTLGAQRRSAWQRRALTGGLLAALVASVYALRRRR